VRFLFVIGGSYATVFTVVPLASAARTAGHEVIVASSQLEVQGVADLGLPAVAVTEMSLVEALFSDRDGTPIPPPAGEEAEMAFAGRGFARLAAASYPALESLASVWRPDLVVGGSHAHGAPLVAQRFNIPFVRQAWDTHERTEVDMRAATEELQPELNRLGLDRIPDGDLYIDFTPPSLRGPDAEPAQLMRWTPGNRQVPLQPWMYTKGDRPRVCLTSGSRAMFIPSLGPDFFRGLITNPALADVEIVVATPDPIAAELRAAAPDLKAGWLPLEVVAPTCDLIIHHGGGVTALNAINAGVPQLSLPEMASAAIPLRRIDDFGASITLASHEESTEDVAAACKELLTNPSYRERSQDLQREMAAQPSPAEVVTVMEKLVGPTAA
jgi:UDP:flavonoid glycosyltransferase YjiC (YdhE family)